MVVSGFKYPPLLSRDAGPVFVRIAKPSRNTPRKWLLMTRHVVDINLAYTITKRNIGTQSVQELFF